MIQKGTKRYKKIRKCTDTKRHKKIRKDTKRYDFAQPVFGDFLTIWDHFSDLNPQKAQFLRNHGGSGPPQKKISDSLEKIFPEKFYPIFREMPLSQPIVEVRSTWNPLRPVWKSHSSQWSRNLVSEGTPNFDGEEYHWMITLVSNYVNL